MITLNQAQEQAATALTGPVLVLAGAGAGKTGTLTERIIKLIEAGTNPQAICAVTFTNKAAGEMRERVRRAIADSPHINFPVEEYGSLPWVGTFHALGIMIIKENYAELGIKKHFTIYDRDDARRAIKEAVKRRDFDPKQWDTKQVLGLISKNKGNFVSLDDFKSQVSSSYFTDNVIEIWQEYEQIKKQDHALDFDDLLLLSTKLLQSQEAIRKHYQQRFSHIHVDEYQDTNKVQYTMIRLLVNPETNNIFCVGDPDQLIYAWRGAKLSNIMRFEKDFADAQVIVLEQNYRSTGNIIAASNAVIAENSNRFEKELFTEQAAGELVGLYGAYNARDEARFVARVVKEQMEKGVQPKNIAVLYRANFQSRILEEACLRAGVPYQVLGTKFFDRQEVRDVMAYIRAAFNPEALVDVRRVINTPRRGIGKVSLLKIFNGSSDELSPKVQKELTRFYDLLSAIATFAQAHAPSETVHFVIQESGLEAMYRESGKEEDLERVANMYELAVVAEKYDALIQEEGLEKFLEDIALMGDQDTAQEEQNSIKLMTIHAAKGLEFDTVFLTGCEEDMFSPRTELDRKAQEEKIEEERRLFYVAMTRARKKLLLSWASMREIFGNTVVNTMTHFIQAIPGSLIEEEFTDETPAWQKNRSIDAFDGIDHGGDDGEAVIELLDW